MFKLVERILSNFFIKVFLLFIFIMAVFGFENRHFFVHAFSSQINILPSAFELDSATTSPFWQGVKNVFYQDLSQEATFDDFNKSNSAILSWEKASSSVSSLSGQLVSTSTNEKINEKIEISTSTEDGTEKTIINAEDEIDLEKDSEEKNPVVDYQADSSIDEKNRDEGQNLEETGDGSEKQDEEVGHQSDDKEIIGNNEQDNLIENDNSQKEEDKEKDSIKQETAPLEKNNLESGDGSVQSSNSGGEVSQASLVSSLFQIGQNFWHFKSAQASDKVTDKKFIKSIYFKDFSVPEDYQENDFKEVNLRLSMAAFSKKEGDALAIYYSDSDNKNKNWKLLDRFLLQDPVSNVLNNDYFSFSLPSGISFEEINNLQIKISIESESKFEKDNLATVFIDSLWLEAVYNDNQEKQELADKTTDDKKLGKILGASEDLNFDLDLVSRKKDFDTTEIPEFNFKFKKKKGFVKKIIDSLVNIFRDEYKGLKIEAKVKGLRLGDDNSEIKPKVKYLKDGEFEVSFPSDIRAFKPGKYTLDIDITDNGEKYSSQQNFSWGVLALNANKTVYKPKENAYLQMAVLDENGDTLCDVEYMLLEIHKPDGTVDYLSTYNGEIELNPDCSVNNVMTAPDYFAHYKLGGVGYYDLTLTVKNNNGEYKISDTLEVKNGIPYEIERIGPTRIYPKALYKMGFKVKANQNYSGEFVEKIPLNFGLKYSKEIIVKKQDNYQELHWTVDWKAGETYEFNYIFDAPNISPEFYLFGPARVDDFEEARQWQIASDAPAGEINHAYVSYDAQLTQTLNYNTDGWSEVPEYKIASSTFQAGDKYLLLVNFSINNSNTNANSMARVRHGSTEFSDSTFAWETRRSSATYTGHGYQYFTVWTAVDGEDIHIDVSNVGSTDRDVRTEGYQAFVMDLSEDLTENTDWYFASSSHSGNLATSWSTDGSNINITGNDHDWMIMSMGRFLSDSTSADFQMRLDNTTDATTHTEVRYETEDNNDYRDIVIMTGDTIAGTENWRVDAQVDTAGTHDWTESQIFALDLNAFREHKIGTSTSAISITPQNSWTETYAMSNYNVEASADTFVWSNEVIDMGENRKVTYPRLQVDGVTTPTGFDDFTRELPHGTTDEDAFHNFFVSEFSMGTHTIAVDMDETVDDSPTPVADIHNLVAFSMELAPITILNVLSREQYRSDASTAIANGGFSDGNVVLSAVASDMASTSAKVDFYYELIATSSSFTTATTVPASVCSEGTDFTDCSSKMWKKSASTTPNDWYDSAWLYRKKITINANQVVANETDFPILATTTDINLADTSSGGHVASSTGADILITDSDGQTKLNYEREYYDSSSGEIVMWIKTDISSTTNKDLYIYYGNSSIATDQATTTGVWDDAYHGVWHLSETPSDGGTHYDSTSYHNDGTLVDSDGDSNTDVSGKIDGADSLNGDADIINCGNSTSLNPYNITIEAWVKADTLDNWDGILSNMPSWGTGFSLQIGTTQNIAAMVSGAYLKTSWAPSVDTWYHIVATHNASNDLNTLYVNGAYENSFTREVTWDADAKTYLGSFYTSPSLFLDGTLEEVRVSSTTRSASWIKTEYRNQLDVDDFLSFSNEEGVGSDTPLVNVAIDNITDGGEYKWQVMVCETSSSCTEWSIFNSTIPNFVVDNSNPTVPGNLTLASKTTESVTLNFGYETVDSNFDTYKIFYKEASSGVTESDTEHIDSNLAYINYNGESGTTITDLLPNSTYVFNIWAYDKAGNKSQATELTVSTSEPSRARTVEFMAGNFSASGDTTTAKMTDTENSFSEFNIKLAEKNVKIVDAYIVFETQFEAYVNNSANYTGYNLSFDTCQSPCTVDAWSGSGKVLVDDNTTLAYNESESNQARLLMDVSKESQLASYTGGGKTMKAQFGYNIERGSALETIASARAKLVLTYYFDEDSESFTNTVKYPLESNAAGDAGTRQSVMSDDCTLDSNCPTFSYNMTVPEISSSPAGANIGNWFTMYDLNDLNNSNDIVTEVNIEGNDATNTTYVHECALAGTQSTYPAIYFPDTPGFNENTDQDLEFYSRCPAGNTSQYLVGGEVTDTYIASSSVNIKTRTVSFPIGVIDNGLTTASSTASVNVYFPENGDNTGIVDIKKAWFRVLSSDPTTGARTLGINMKVGDNATTTTYNYAYDPGGSVVKPSFNIVQVIPESNYDELELANGETSKNVQIEVKSSNDTSAGGVSAELMITYTYSSESSGYLASFRMLGGQSMSDADNKNSTSSIAKVILPEKNNKTILAAGLLASFLMTDSDANVAGAYTVDANMSSTSPSCSASFNARTDSTNAFNEFYQNVTSALSTDNNVPYNICYANNGGGDAGSGGAKTNSQLIYTYSYYNPPNISAEASNQYKSDNFTAINNGAWTDESEVYLKADSSYTSSTTNQIDFYFELLGDNGSFSTSTGVISGACLSGVSFDSCSTKTWKATTSAAGYTDWYDSAWLYRRKITINANQVVANETDFPILATTTDIDLADISSGGHVASSTGADILITDSDGQTKLNYEREYYDSSSGEIVMWIKTDISSTVNKDLYIYYGNSSIATDQATTTGVWDDNYRAVWHLSESGTAIRKDSTKYANNGTPLNYEGDEGVAGKIDGSDNLDGGDDVQVSNNASLEPSTFTLETWMKTSDNGTYQGAFTKLRSGAYQGYNLNKHTSGQDKIRMMIGDSSSYSYINSDDAYTDNKWHHVVGLYDGIKGYLYVDGVKQASEATQNVEHIGDDLYIGRYYTNSTSIRWDNDIDEIRISSSTRSDSWIKTEYRNQLDASKFASFSSFEQSYAALMVEGEVDIPSISDSSIGYKWQVKACDNTDSCSVWDKFGISPNFKVDTHKPITPGNLTLATTTPTTATLSFGSQTVDDNFESYKIFYKAGISNVDTGDTEQIDNNLKYIDYNGATSTLISNLEANTQYVVNIYAYDEAGNVSSANELVFTTATAPHQRANSVKFLAGVYTGDGTSGQNSDTDQNFSTFNFKLVEDDVHIKNAFIIFESQYLAYSSATTFTGYKLSFDTCEEPCTADAWNGSGSVMDDDNSILSYTEDESNQVRLLFDVTDEVQLAAYNGGSELEAQVGYNLETGSAIDTIANARAVLVITYSYNGDTSESITNTVSYPLNSEASGDMGTKQSRQDDDCSLNTNCPLFSYTAAIPEVSQKLGYWFQTYGGTDLQNTNDVVINVNIETVDVNSDSMTHEAYNGGTQGNLPTFIFDSVYGFSENTAQELEYHAVSPGGAKYDMIGGELFETYTASSSATTKTRTVVYPIGVLNNGYTTAVSSSSVNVYFPENGKGSGIVDIKNAWFRVSTNYRDSTDSTMGLASQVGASSTSPYIDYFLNTGGSVPKPNIKIVHIIGDKDLDLLEEANIDTPVKVSLYSQASLATWGGVSAELVITYTYTDESSGYLSSLDIFGGQSNTDSNATLVNRTSSKAVFSELRGSKILRGASINPSYLLTTSDGSMPGNVFLMDANVSVDTATCVDSYGADDDATNAFISYYKDITSSFSSVNNQRYNVCMSASSVHDTNAGAKMNAIISYVYQWNAPQPEFTQSDWRWYENYDGVQPTTPLAQENTSLSNINIGDTLRLRINVGVTKENLLANKQTFKLQYGAGSDCSAISTWVDVDSAGGSGVWLGYNNPEPVDGQDLTATLLASSTIYESYEESNTSVANPRAASIGNFAEWDFALYNNKASSSDYCFRIAKSNGASLNDYLADSYPHLGTAPANSAPSSAYDLAQHLDDGTTKIPNSGWINENNILLTAAVTDPNINETPTLYFELKLSSGSLTTATSEPSGACVYGTAYDSCASKIWFVAPSSSGDYRTNPYVGTTSITNLATTTPNYKWQVLACDKDALCSSWVSPGLSPNFKIDMTRPTIPGDLTYATSTPTSITLDFGASTVDDNFDTYKIFYKLGSSTVEEIDNEHVDSNLGYIDYNGAATTTVINLSANSTYIFNIWAYDLAGNVASATTAVVASTTSSFTPPTGSIVDATEKTDGSGGVDLVIHVDDADNDDTLRAKLEYVQGLSCDFASPLDPTLDETDDNITATYGDPDVDNNSTYQIGTSTSWIITSPGSNYVFVDWLSKIDEPLADDTYCLRLTVNDGLSDQSTALSQRTVLIDNQAPSVPGNLSLFKKNLNSAQLTFGTESSDPSFNQYKIFYKKGTSGVTESDTEHTDSNLLVSDYSGATSTLVNNLEANTNYVFNIYAYDDYGNVASATEITFKTNAGPVNASAIEQYEYPTLTSVSNGAWSSSNDLVFRAGAHDQDSGDILTFYYEIVGVSDSFTTATATPQNTCASSTSFVSCASNIWAVSTSSSELPADWYSGDWFYRKKITIHASQIEASMNNFTILATTTDSDLASKARSDGYDILFTDSSGTTTLPYEREYYNPSTGKLVAWINTDVSSTTDTTIYMYYGNLANTIDFSTTTGVWDSDFVGVWHLGESVVDESSASSTHYDSTANNNIGDQLGNNEVNAYIGRGQEIDNDDKISIADSSSLDVADALTISAWVNGTVSLDKSGSYSLDIDSSTATGTINSNSLGVGLSGAWNNIVLTYDRTAGTNQQKMYINGDLIASTNFSSAINNSASRFIFSSLSSANIDEVQLSSVARSASWIKTNYNTQSQNGNFVSMASESRVKSYFETNLVVDFPDSSAGYKWQVLACDDDEDCSSWNAYNDTIPNFKVDVLDPTAPGQLTESSKTSNKITLAYGAQTTENNFKEYRIFYSTTSPVTEASIEYDVADLDYINYNGETLTTIEGLLPDTTYYFNIWAYDQVGRKASSSISTIATNPAMSSPGAVFYTKGDRILYYRVWDGTSWQAEQSGPTMGSGAGDNIRQVRAVRSDDGGKIAIMTKTDDGNNREWWGTVYYFVADSFATTTQLGATAANAVNPQLMSGCMASLSSGEFVVLTADSDTDGDTQVYSWNASAGWTSEGNGPYTSNQELAACKFVRRPGTDNYLVVLHDDQNDIYTSYYYGGSTYANSWTTVEEHSTVEEDNDNFAGDAFFDPSDNTRGAIEYSNSNTNTYTYAKYFVCDDTGINYGSAVASPQGGGDDWANDFVHGEFGVNPSSTGDAYFVGRDIDDEINVYKVNASSPTITWSTLTGGDDINPSALYNETNDAQKPFAIDFYKDDRGVVVWDSNASGFPIYHTINATTDTVSGTSSVPGATVDNWNRVRIYDDPSEEEFAAIYQNDNVDYTAVFWDGASDSFYSSGNQAWTSLASGLTVTDKDDENIAFAFSAYNSPPTTPSSLGQLKLDASTVIENLSWTNENSIYIKANVNDVDTEEGLKVYLELLANTDTYTSTTSEPVNACSEFTSFGSCNSKIWEIASSTIDDYSSNPLLATTTISGLSDSSIGYKWRVLACDDEHACSAWKAFNSNEPNFKVDTVAPIAPGALSVSSVDSGSATLNFGATTTEDNFREYRIYYKKGSSEVSTSDNLYASTSDANLANILFNSAVDTSISGLSSSTEYVFNIWAYDLAGNMASATPEVSTTTSALANIEQVSYLFENDDGIDVNNNSTATSSFDVNLNNIYIGERFNLRIQLENNGGDIFSSKVYKLQFDVNANSSWTDIDAGTAISYSYGLSGANGDIINSNEAAPNSAQFIDGTWHENTSFSSALTLDKNNFSELVFALETNQATLSDVYRFRLYNSTDDKTLDTYSVYPQITIASSEQIRYSKDAVSSLDSLPNDADYYFDPVGYEDVSTDNAVRDEINSNSEYAVFNFAVKHNNNTDAINVTWNGQSSVEASTNKVYLQVYTYGSPNEWTTIASSSNTTSNTDFNLTANINSSLSNYYDTNYWTYWRVYQDSGSQSLKTDLMSVVFSAPTADVDLEHYRWRNDDGSESGASWREAEDEGDPSGSTSNIDKNENIRLRISVKNQGAGSATNYNYKLEVASTTGNCSTDPGYWVSVGTTDSAEWRVATSTNVSDNDTISTSRLSSSASTFSSGYVVAYSSVESSNITLAEDYYTELEYLIKPTNNAVTAGTYCFRVTNGGTALDSYSQYPVITIAGNTNNAPNFSVGGDPTDADSAGGSASTTPTYLGDTVTFAATGEDADNDSYYLAICKADSITPGNDGPPTCGGAGDFCISSLASSTDEASCDYTADDSNEVLPWYAFVCDKHPGFSIAKCSASSQGAGTSEIDSPVVINHPPSFTSVSTEVPNQDPGSTFTFKAVASDSDVSGGDDTVTLYICGTDSATWSGCDGTTICSSASSSDPYCSYSDTAPTPAGSVNYYAFIFDNHSLASTDNSRSSSYTINNVAPIIGTVTLNDGNDISANIKGMSDTVVNVVSSSVVDMNGCSDLVSAVSSVYLSNVANGPTCTADNNNCYQITTGGCNISDCSGGSDTSAAITCSTNIKYYIMPTDSYSNDDTLNWIGYVQVNDGSNLPTATTTPVDVLTNIALDVAEPVIDFGSDMYAGEDTGSVNSTTTVENAGNSPIDTNISGTDMSSPGYDITVDNIEWSLNNFDYGAGTGLTGAGTDVDIVAPKPTDATGTDDQLYWGLNVPYGADASSYVGQNTFTVILDSDDW